MLTVVWIYFFLPEIKNRTLEEVDELFEARLPAREFRNYVCVGRHISDEKVITQVDERSGSAGKDKEAEQTVTHIEKSA